MNTNTISITDMYFAAVLLAYGAELKEIDRSDYNHQRFLFVGEVKEIYILSDDVVLRVENPTFDAIRAKFVARKLMFPPSYVDEVRRVRTVIHDTVKPVSELEENDYK